MFGLHVLHESILYPVDDFVVTFKTCSTCELPEAADLSDVFFEFGAVLAGIGID